MNTSVVCRYDTFVAPVVPPSAINALKLIRQDYPDAFIAGGYLRDLYCGKEPRDLDVFTFTPPKEDEKEDGIDKSETYGVARILLVANRNIPDVDIGVQVVFLNYKSLTPPTAGMAVSQFALGMQQAWYEGDTVLITEAFTRDVRLRRFTVTFCEDEKEALCILQKYHTLRRRYPSFRLYVPPQFASHFHVYHDPTDPMFKEKF